MSNQNRSNNAFARIHGNNSFIQHFPQLRDESNANLTMEEQSTDRRLQSASEASERILSTKNSEAPYEGDDELDESESATTQHENQVQEGAKDADPDNLREGLETNSTNITADEEDQGNTLDFVHVHLEHLPSHDEVQQPQPASISNNEQHYGYQKVKDSHFSYYRKFASQGSSSKEHNSPSNQPPTTVPSSPTSQSGDKNASPHHPTDLTHSTQTALQGTFRAPPKSNDSTSAAGDDDETSLLDGHILQDEDFDFVNMATTGTAEEETTVHSATSVDSPEKQLHHSQTSDIAPACTSMNSSDGQHVTGCEYPQKWDMRIQETTTDKSDTEIPIQCNEHGNDHKEEGFVLCAPAKVVNFSDSDADQHCASYSSNGDSRNKEREARKEKRRKKRDEKIRMTLLQTIQHNTRANFCAFFLMVVALATLVLLLVAKWWSTKSEFLFYDEEQDQHFVVSDTEKLITTEVLAFALITVLLLGSLCYLCAATRDSHGNGPLIRAVRHEDACLANVSARRKHPTRRSPFVSGYPGGWYGSRRHKDDDLSGYDTDQQSQTSYTDHYSYFHKRKTLSMTSAGTSVEELDNNEEILISVEEAEKYYRALEEEDAGLCCSPVPSIHAASTEEQMETGYDRFDDDDDEHYGRRKSSRGMFA